MKKVIIYPGRFQPMMSHHAQVFSKLQSQFPEADVYMATSDKTEPETSPFDFAEKQQIGKLGFGLRSDRLLQVRRPYNVLDYPFDLESTVMIFAVGEKDWERFAFDQQNSETGLNMQKRDPSKPTLLQPINTMGRDPLPAKYRAYVMLTPDIEDSEGEATSASNFRKRLRTAPDVQTARRVFQKHYGEYNEQLFNLLYNKIVEPIMQEQDSDLQQMRKLAGLDTKVQQEAAVEYYDISDEEKQLASLGRVLMKQAESEQDESLANTMAKVGQKFTVYGAPNEPNTLGDLAKNLEVSEEMLLKFAELAQKIYDSEGDAAVGEEPEPEELFQESQHVSDDEYITKRVVGHHDNEARMMQRDLLKIRDYADELVSTLDNLQDGDFPHWWQAKVVKAASYMGSVKHFLDGEMRLGPRDHIGHNKVDMGPVADDLLADNDLHRGFD